MTGYESALSKLHILNETVNKHSDADVHVVRDAEMLMQRLPFKKIFPVSFHFWDIPGTVFVALVFPS